MSLIRGNALAVPLADESVDLIVTSPPYFALRSYTDDSCATCGGRNGQAGTGDKRTEAASTGLQGGKQPSFKENANVVPPDPDCPDCNGTGRGHYDGQIGSEATPAEFVAALLGVTSECVRVLKPSGSLWVNLGDKYAGSGQRSYTNMPHSGPKDARLNRIGGVPDAGGIPTKSLMGLPWRYALGCIDDLGLILRAEVIWSKPNGLPESVQDRVRRSHEQWFHMVKEPRYFSAVDEIREQHSPNTSWKEPGRYDTGYGDGVQVLHSERESSGLRTVANPLGKLPGSVWTIPTEPLRVPDHLPQHFAAFPSEWPKRIILGWSPSGICVECGEGRRPVVEKGELVPSSTDPSRQTLIGGHGTKYAGRSDGGEYLRATGGPHMAKREREITGESCGCPTPDAPTHPSVILDPFAGTGTTVAVADALGRHGIGLDLSADYLKLARWRCQDPGLRAKVLGVDKPKPETAGQLSLMEAS